MAWLVLDANDTGAVVRALGLRTVMPSNWRSGLVEVADGGVFVTPPIAGRVLAIGSVFAAHDAENRVPPLLERLSREFGRAAWFAVDDDGEQHGWAFAERGELHRGYAFDGERGHVFWHGEVTDAERALDCFVDDPRDGSDDDVKWWPDARTVHNIAAAWAFDARQLPSLAASPSTGSVGRL